MYSHIERVLYTAILNYILILVLRFQPIANTLLLQNI